MRELPTGTVTFLFTDIEGSTRLLAELGAGYAEALAEHRRVLRTAFTAHGGVEVDTQGDAFFVAFAAAEDALAAAAEAQAALSIPVRMGIHTGEPELADEGYVGLDVHRGARVCAAAHGGQVVVSGRTNACVLEHMELRDLGLHRLKDLAEPVRLYQLGEHGFPPLRSLNATNLPVQPNALIGRERELEEITALFRECARLVTLTGPGGTGKTRLALQAAAELVDDFPDGVFWVSLAALRDPDLVIPTIERTLGATSPLAEHVDEQLLLLLLDNLEQVAGCGPALADTLARCPNLHLLVTSRVPLLLQAERELAVPPLGLPDAEELFYARAMTVEQEEAVAEICRRLDGLPLAIELAAARTRVLPPHQLLERLDQRLPLLVGGPQDAPERQRTLRATLEWSHDLLAPAEQSLFARLAVFAGGCTLEAVEEVTSAQLATLEALVQHSLLRVGGGRFAMLETIREYALERLDQSSDADDVRRRLAAWLLKLASRHGDVGGEPKRDDEVLAELDNCRAALAWSFDADPELGLRLAVAFEGTWVIAAPVEGMQWYERLLERTPDAPLELRGHALRACGSTANPAGREDVAERVYSESLAAFRALGDDGAAAVLELRLGYAALYRRDLGRARSLAGESLAGFGATGNKKGESQSVSLLGEVEYAQGNHATGISLLERSAKLADEAGFAWWRAGALGRLADCLLDQGQAERAETVAREAVAISVELRDRLRVVRGLARLACIAAERGQAERAGRLWGAVEAEEARGRIGAWERERDRFEQRVLARAVGAALEQGREQGRQQSLDAAVQEALVDASR